MSSVRLRFVVSLAVHRLLPEKDRSFSVVLASKSSRTGSNFDVSLHPLVADAPLYFHDRVFFPVHSGAGPSGGKPHALYKEIPKPKESKVDNSSHPSEPPQKSISALLDRQERSWISLPVHGERLVSQSVVSDITITLPTKEHTRVPLQMMVLVFVHTVNPDGAEVQELFCQGSIGFHELCSAIAEKHDASVSLFDVDSFLQGTLRLSWKESPDLIPEEARKTLRAMQTKHIVIPVGDLEASQREEKEEAFRQITAIESRWSSVLRKYYPAISDSDVDRNTFPHFISAAGYAIPIWAFAALSRKIKDVDENGRLTTPETSIALLKHWAALAIFLFKDVLVSPRHRERQSKHEREGNVLNEFLTLVFRAMLYSPDAVHRKDAGKGFTRRYLTDQWISTSTMPVSAYSCFDCEDGSLYVLQVFRVLRALDNHTGMLDDSEESRALAAISKVAKLYTPFFCLGEIQTGSDGHQGIYSPHAFVVLIPRKALRRALSDASGSGFVDRGTVKDTALLKFGGEEQGLRPSLLIESTTYSDGAWTDASMTDGTSEQRFDAAYEPFDTEEKIGGILSPQHFRRAVKPKASVSAVVRHGIYRHIFAAITPSGSQFRNTDSDPVRYETFVFRAGTHIHDFMMRREGVEMRSVETIRKSEEAKSMLGRFLGDYPMGTITHTPDEISTLEDLRQKLPVGGVELVFAGRENEIAGNSASREAVGKHMEKNFPGKEFQLLSVPILKELNASFLMA